MRNRRGHSLGLDLIVLVLAVTTLVLVTVPASAVSIGAEHVTALGQLPGDAGCLKGRAGKSFIPCEGSVLGQYDVSSIAISPDGRFAYAVSLYAGQTEGPDGSKVYIPGGTIVSFARDPDSGALRQLEGEAACIKDRDGPVNPVTKPCTQSALGLGGAKTITLSPDGRFAYVAALLDGAIAAFRRNEETGALTQLAGEGACVEDELDARELGPECPVAGPGLHGVRWVTVSPDGNNLYASSPANDAIAAFARDRESGALTQLEGDAACIEDRLARLAGSCQAKGVGLNYPRSLTVSPDGRNVYVASDSADATYPNDAADGDAVSAFARDPETGALTQLEGDAACIKDTLARRSTACPVVGKGLLGAFSVTVSPDGKNVYVGSVWSRNGEIAAFRRNPDSGALTQLEGGAACLGARDCTPTNALKGVNGVTISADGRYAYVAAFYGLTVTILQRSPDTGQLSPFTRHNHCIRDIRSEENCPTTVRGLEGPREVTLSPDGNHAYVPSSTSGTIDVFDVRPPDAEPVEPDTPVPAPASVSPATPSLGADSGRHSAGPPGGPPGDSRRKARMPRLLGLSPKAAARRLRSMPRPVRVSRIYRRRAPRHARTGRVFRQFPKSGSRIVLREERLRVRLVVYAGHRGGDRR